MSFHLNPRPFQAKRLAVPMDIELSKDHDMLSVKGFLNAVFQILNLAPGTGAWTAPVCSSWTFMSLGCVRFSLKRRRRKLEHPIHARTDSLETCNSTKKGPKESKLTLKPFTTPPFAAAKGGVVKCCFLYQIDVTRFRAPRNRGTSGRTAGRPLGRRDYPSVRDANLMVARVMILVALCECKKDLLVS